VSEPESILRSAFEAAKDRKAVIRYGAIAASGAYRSKWSAVIDSFHPLVHPLDAVEEWADTSDVLGERKGWLRPFEIATWWIIPIAIAADKLFVLPSAVVVAGIFVGDCVIAFAAKQYMAWSLRRQVASLDERAALEIVVEFMTNGLAKNPEREPGVVKVLNVMQRSSARREAGGA